MDVDKVPAPNIDEIAVIRHFESALTTASVTVRKVFLIGARPRVPRRRLLPSCTVLTNAECAWGRWPAPWCELCPRQDSNLRSRFRKPMLYPLSYGSYACLLHSCSNLSIV